MPRTKLDFLAERTIFVVAASRVEPMGASRAIPQFSNFVSSAAFQARAVHHRILIIFEGKIVKEFASGEASDEELGYFMTGGGGDKLNAETEEVIVSDGGTDD